MEATSLPPGVTLEQGEMVRYLEGSAESGAKFKRRRIVYSSLEEAKEKFGDYYSPVYGWILDGRKMQKEHFLDGGQMAVADETPVAPVIQPVDLTKGK